MSGTLNKVMLIGHLGDEVKIHRFEDGGCVGRFPLATNETYLNKQTNERVSNLRIWKLWDLKIKLLFLSVLLQNLKTK